jgi:branched-chain amino acid transport system substrate-binding protein
MLKHERGGSGGRALILVILIGLAAGACGNSSASRSPEQPPSTPRDWNADLSGVPGVTPGEIRFSVLGTSSNNPLGTCILDCYVDGIKAYFAYRNNQGGVDGRKLVVAKEVDDELGQNQAKAIEIVSADDTFAAFNASEVAGGFAEFAKAGVPLYVWALQHADMNGKDSIFGNREVVCITCVSRAVPYIAQRAGAARVASLGYGIHESSKQCAVSSDRSLRRYGGDVGAKSVYLNDNLPFGLTNGIGPEVTAMKKAGVDLIVGCLDLNGMKTLAQELRRQGMDDVVMYHLNTYDQKFVNAAGDLFEGDYVQTTFRPFEADAGHSSIAQYKKWMAKAGSSLTELAMIGWINADLAYTGLKAAGPNFDRAKVIAATNKLTRFTAGGLTQPVDWSRQHVLWTDPDPATHGPAHDCIALVKVHDGRFEVVGDRAKPWMCWPGRTRAWSEPVPTNFG